MSETLEFYKRQVEALRKLADLQDEIINDNQKTIDELTFKYADSMARLNIMIRNIEVVDSVFEKPIKK